MSTIVPGPGDTVLKVYPGSLDRETRTALDREWAALSGIASILPVEEIGKLADGRTALRMPRCDRSLATLTEPLPVQDALLIGETVARALAAAHRSGVVHGSVSPGNVLIRRTGEPVVADFGVALRRRFPRDPLHGLEFAAPETVRDQTMDERTDRYGLGAVLYLALTGEPPHRTVVGEHPGTRIHRVLTEPVAPITRPEVPDELVALVGELLAKDPDSRPEDPETRLKHLHRKLTAAHAGIPLDLPAEPILVLEPSRPERPPTETAASKRKYVIAAAVLAGICGAVAVPWLLSGRGEPPSVAPTTAAPPSSGVEIDLAPPVDHETYVELSWTSSAELDFAIILAEEGRAEPQVILTQRTKKRRVEVRPGLRYCFQIQGSSPQGTYESEFRPLRGAVCKT
ncbi:protein kinase domain-containing protein [Amycolatopsis sp. EV170708-02-1]|uniref:serine/threonine protein kinase n=1 Tax=Amycolatopsis sp. EV170708-02-1 TaxID=2919322 RepID=UPI001F0CCE6D|nr:protein kinase [Amycolatopsis sp. EV170708-02-1]UMP01294.1 protein kinase [Amycolatopsis sp. EV170708-02-1]